VRKEENFQLDSRHFKIYLEEWIQPRSKRTSSNYITYLRQFLLFLQNNEGLPRIPRRKDLIDYTSFLSEQELSTGTKNQYLRIARSFYSYIYRKNQKFFDEDITLNIKLFQEDKHHKKEAFSEEEIEKIIEGIDTTTTKGKRDKALILLLVTTGMRINEARLIDLKDIETIQGKKRVYIQRKRHTSKDTFVIIPEEIEPFLNEYLETRPNRKPDEPLFTGTGNRNKGRISETSYSRLLKTIFREQGFDSNKLTPHSIRHTTARAILHKGGDIEEVKIQLGHESIATSGIYTEEDKREQMTTSNDIYNQIFNKNKLKKQQEIIQQIKNLDEIKLQELKKIIENL
jgi:site-specific recombinase XerD